MICAWQGSFVALAHPSSSRFRRALSALLFLLLPASRLFAAETAVADHYRQQIKPLLTQYCGDCHTDGESKGHVAFDTFKSEAALAADHDLWLRVIKNVRANLMPPDKKPKPSPEELARLEAWIKYDSFGIDPKNPDPGRVTVRRLNRAEYHNTIKDLMGVDFNADAEFPPDDTGYGFDDIGDVLTLSPMLLEKYLAAAQNIVTQAVPLVARVPAEQVVTGKMFERASLQSAPKDTNSPPAATGTSSASATKKAKTAPKSVSKDTFAVFSYYEPGAASASFNATQDGDYQLSLELATRGNFEYDPGRCKVTFKIDDQEVLAKEFGWYDFKTFHFDYPRALKQGEHHLSFAIEPLTDVSDKINSLDIRLVSFTFRGPMAPEFWKHPKNYDRFFTTDAPADPAGRRSLAREVIGKFARKAFRRPVDDRQINRLTALAESVYSQPDKTFEAGVAQAMVAIIASPYFVFRLEQTDPASPAGGSFADVDEYSLASRLSYFLWATMPDEELLQLAGRRELRQNLAAQVKRMMDDPRSENLIKNFSGQWLQTRDVIGASINARAVLARDDNTEKQMREQLAAFRARQAKAQPNSSTNKTAGAGAAATASATNSLASLVASGVTNAATSGGTNSSATAKAKPARNQPRFTPPRVELDTDLRDALTRETQMFVSSVAHEDRPVTDLIEADYIFVNQKLAKVYGITNISGTEMRRITLPADSPRGGVLTEGSLLVVTSNPDRTSPVKRGLFILDNILGTPAPPAPANVPALEAAEHDVKGHDPTLREALAIHREKPLCASCHNRMDPIGLAFENFNALGMWRDKERGQTIDTQGRLVTGESFTTVRELKHILAHDHRQDFYRCLTEKMLIYALGRGPEYYDVEAMDQIVARLNNENGRFSALLMGIIESAPFQKERRHATATTTLTASSDSNPPAAQPVQSHPSP